MKNLLDALSSGDDQRAEAAVLQLAALPPQVRAEILPALREWLHSPHADARWWAARALSALPGAEPPALLATCLGDPDPAVRQCAALGLHNLAQAGPERIAAAIPPLVQALADPDRLAARLAGDALAAAGPTAVPPLLEALPHAPHPVRLEIVRTLAHIQDHRSIPALFEALDDSALIEYWANEGLERMGVGMTFFLPS